MNFCLWCCFPLTAFRVLSLSLSFNRLTIMCLSVDLMIILCIWGFVELLRQLAHVFYQIQEISEHISSNIFSASFSACVCAQSLSHVQLFVTSALQPARFFFPWDFPGKNTGVGCHFLLWGIFLTHGLNPRLLHWPVDYLPQTHQGSLLSPWDSHVCVGRVDGVLK